MLKQFKFNGEIIEFDLVSKERFITAHFSDFTSEYLDKLYEHLLNIDFVPDDNFDPLDTQDIHKMLKTSDLSELGE